MPSNTISLNSYLVPYSIKDRWFPAKSASDPDSISYTFYPAAPYKFGSKLIFNCNSRTLSTSGPPVDSNYFSYGESNKYFQSESFFDSVPLTENRAYLSETIFWNETYSKLIFFNSHEVGGEDDSYTPTYTWHYSSDNGNTWVLGDSIDIDLTPVHPVAVDDYAAVSFRRITSASYFRVHYDEVRNICVIFGAGGDVWKATLSNGLPGTFTKIFESDVIYTSIGTPEAPLYDSGCDSIGTVNYKVPFTTASSGYLFPAVTTYGVFYPYFVYNPVEYNYDPNKNKNVSIGYLFDTNDTVIGTFNNTDVSDFDRAYIYSVNDVLVMYRTYILDAETEIYDYKWIYSTNGSTWTDFTSSLIDVFPTAEKVSISNYLPMGDEIAFDGVNYWIAVLYIFESSQRVSILKSVGTTLTSWVEIEGFDPSWYNVHQAHVAATSDGKVAIDLGGASEIKISGNRGLSFRTLDEDDYDLSHWKYYASSCPNHNTSQRIFFMNDTLCMEIDTGLDDTLYGPVFLRLESAWPVTVSLDAFLALASPTVSVTLDAYIRNGLSIHYVNKDPQNSAYSCMYITDVQDLDSNHWKHVKRVSVIGDYGDNEVELQWVNNPTYTNWSSLGIKAPTDPSVVQATNWYNLGQARRFALSLTWFGNSNIAHDAIEVRYNIKTR